MLALFEDFVERIRSEYSAKDPTRSELEVIGNELKTICSRFIFDENVYRLAGSGDDHRVVSESGERCIREGDMLVMEAHEIHAIDSSRGIHPTYHVHVYGRSLPSLPGFNSRCYKDVTSMADENITAISRGPALI